MGREARVKKQRTVKSSGQGIIGDAHEIQEESKLQDTSKFVLTRLEEE